MLYNNGNYILLVVPMRLLLSDHARRRMFERGISMEEIAEAITRGRKWREGERLHATVRNIEVVYKVAESDIFVITVHYR
jgi:hypothetical protein